MWIHRKKKEKEKKETEKRDRDGKTDHSIKAKKQ
jgi:hypothetical protein